MFRPSRPPQPGDVNRAVLARFGIVGLWAMQDQGLPRNLAEATLATSATALPRPTQWGTARFFNGQSNTHSINTGYTGQLGNFTAGCWFRALGASATVPGFDRLVDKKYNTGFVLCRQGTTANTWGAYVVDAAATNPIMVALPDGAPHMLAVTRSGTTATVYGDGGAVTASRTVSAAALSAEPLRFGESPAADAYNNFNGLLFGGFISNRALSAAEIKEIYEHPEIFYSRGFLEPSRKQRRARVQSLAVPITLTGENQATTSAQTAGALTQAHGITGENQATTGAQTTGAVTQAQALAGDSQTTATGQATGALTQTHALAGEGQTAASAQTAGAIALAGVVTLSGEGQTTAGSQTTGAIAQVHALAATDQAGVTAQETGRIEQAHTLAGQSQVNASAQTVGFFPGAVVVTIINPGARRATPARGLLRATPRRSIRRASHG